MKLIHFISLLLLFFTISCSSLNKNQTKVGSLKLKGGIFNSEKWSQELRFERYSWFKELTLIFDLLTTEVNKSSKFYNWFSESEKEYLNKCEKSFVIVTYAQDSRKIPRNIVLEQYAKYGYSRFSVPNFSKHLEMHPNYEALSLQLYQVDALCLDKMDAPLKGEAVNIRLPGFLEVFLER